MNLSSDPLHTSSGEEEAGGQQQHDDKGNRKSRQRRRQRMPEPGRERLRHVYGGVSGRLERRGNGGQRLPEEQDQGGRQQAVHEPRE